MKYIFSTATVLLSLINSSYAFPPAPHHTFQGLLRDEQGRPITWDITSKIIFETNSGDIIESDAGKIIFPGINYVIHVPMDSGTINGLYKPYAMLANMPFKIKVQIGNKIYLPIEMIGEIKRIGLPGQTTNLDLTIGEDSDGDGLPDAWERALLKNGDNLADINPNDDSDGDGMSNLEEYISGNYAFDKNDGLKVDIVSVYDEYVTIKFLGISGRSYFPFISNDLKKWSKVKFFTENSDILVESIYTNEVEELKLNIPKKNLINGARFFKLQVK